MFKINRGKLENLPRFSRQLDLVLRRYIKPEIHENVVIELGYNLDDLVKDKKTLKLSWDLKEQENE